MDVGVSVAVDPLRRQARRRGLTSAKVTSMDETAAMQRMIDDLRTMRNSCEPKSNENPRYLHYSTAISNLKWLIGDIQRED